MLLKPASGKPRNYTLRLLPYPAGGDIPMATGLAPHHSPAAGQFMLINPPEPTLLMAFDPAAHRTQLIRQIRHMAVQSQPIWGDTPCVDTSAAGAALQTVLTGLAMAPYTPGFYKSQAAVKWPKSLYLTGNDDIADTARKAQAMADVHMRIMELVDLPPGTKTPEYLGQWARKSAKNYGFDCEVWNEKRITATGLHALYAVGKGSDHNPVFIVSRYQGAPQEEMTHLALVGKGVTFDTGGISMKDSTNMHYMKSDMAGGAAVLGAIEWAARLALPINITAAVPVAENAVDARSLLPGDVIQSYAGKTIEVIDTDAEGRLILADALTWVHRHTKPKVIIDLATLTGSSFRALGAEAAALFTQNEALQQSLMKAGFTTGEKLWPMPLWSDYDSYIHSDVADLSNLSPKPVAGAIAAAKFLEVFTENHPAWAHIDMPGQAFGDSPFAKMKSATGYGLHLLAEWMLQFVENTDIRDSIHANP
jgi:leucyl aminopeptidase